MDYTSFSHGQVQSKLWLCTELEKTIKFNAKIAIVGCWYNILGLLLLARHQEKYKYIHGYDIDEKTKPIADKLTDAWQINLDQKIRNYILDVNQIDFQNYDTIICTSTEDIASIDWYTNIPTGKIVCLQSTNLTSQDVQNFNNWYILNSNKNIDEFKNKYPMTKIIYAGQKNFDYGNIAYTRYMLIGVK